MIPITIATEDELSEAIARKLISFYTDFQVEQTLRKGGFGYLKANLKNFFELANHTPVFLITDLDQINCAPTLLQAWKATVNIAQPKNMLFRVAVRETEAWLLADSKNCGTLLNTSKIPSQVDNLLDPKRTLLELAKRASREIRQGLVAQDGALAIQGLEYNYLLSQFVKNQWNPEIARQQSASLDKTCSRLKEMNSRLKAA